MEFIKKSISVLLAAILSAGLMLTGCAAETENSAADAPFELKLQIGNPNMTVGGETKAIDEQGTAPVLVDDRTLLPVRAVVEEMGGAVAWDEETQTVVLAYKSDIILLEIGNNSAYLNESKQILDVAPALIGDRTMMPIRFIAESFGFDVNWDEATRTVTVSKSAG